MIIQESLSALGRIGFSFRAIIAKCIANTLSELRSKKIQFSQRVLAEFLALPESRLGRLGGSV